MACRMDRDRVARRASSMDLWGIGRDARQRAKTAVSGRGAGHGDNKRKGEEKRKLTAKEIEKKKWTRAKEEDKLDRLLTLGIS